MSRSTQYIGLNAKATAFIEKNGLIKREPNDLPKSCIYGYREGMFEEDVPHGTWNAPNSDIWDEVTQVSPWSSGPMIFTCLIKRGTEEKVGEWIQDETIHQRDIHEFSFEEGTFYV